MEPVTTLIGAAALCFGIFTIYLRIQDPSKFKKLEAMKNQFGESAGLAIHFVAYSLIPIIAGIFFLIAGLQGKSVF